MQVLTGLFDFVKDETRRNPFLQLQELINIIELMEKEGLVLPLQQVSGSEKGVNLMTVHGSKGLEFEYVFIVGCNASYWEKKRKMSRGYNLGKIIFDLQEEQDDDQELRRLFYVALTRAEQHLQVSYCRFKPDGKEQEPSMFIAEIREEKQLPIEKVFIDEEIMLEFRALDFGDNCP
jgi:DNA helicase-2/ATP-dependent DNA helicase PcrA